MDEQTGKIKFTTTFTVTLTAAQLYTIHKALESLGGEILSTTAVCNNPRKVGVITGISAWEEEDKDDAPKT